MSASNGRILARTADGVVFFHISGHVTAHCCPALRSFAEQQLTAGAAQVRVALAECSYFDSTFLGTLLCLSRHPALKAPGALQLCTPSPACRQILKQMAVQQLFTVVDDMGANPATGEWQELSGELDRQNSLPFKENVVRAHRELAGVPGPLAQQFQAIVDIASEELDAARAQRDK
jgi:anti-anti-sigma regulatory factor